MKPEFLLLSLIFSFAADVLFLKTPFELTAILFFIAVQYFHRRLQSGSLLSFTASGFFGMFFLLLLSYFWHIKSSLLTAAAFFYIVLLTWNLCSSFTVNRQNTPTLLRVCLVMLLVCDLNVGLFNLPRFCDSLPHSLAFYCSHIAGNLIWLFYLPSQLILLYLFFRFPKKKPSSVLL